MQIPRRASSSSLLLLSWRSPLFLYAGCHRFGGAGCCCSLLDLVSSFAFQPAIDCLYNIVLCYKDFIKTSCVAVANYTSLLNSRRYHSDPIALAEDSSSSAPTHAPPPVNSHPSPSPLSSRTARLLIVDDERDIANLTKLWMESRGFAADAFYHPTKVFLGEFQTWDV